VEVTMEARSAMKLFSALQKLGLMETADSFDIFFVFMKDVEIYADRYKLK
jgi:hypothetical protein